MFKFRATRVHQLVYTHLACLVTSAHVSCKAAFTKTCLVYTYPHALHANRWLVRKPDSFRHICTYFTHFVQSVRFVRPGVLICVSSGTNTHKHTHTQTDICHSFQQPQKAWGRPIHHSANSNLEGHLGEPLKVTFWKLEPQCTILY